MARPIYRDEEEERVFKGGNAWHAEGYHGSSKDCCVYCGEAYPSGPCAKRTEQVRKILADRQALVERVLAVFNRLTPDEIDDVKQACRWEYV